MSLLVIEFGVCHPSFLAWLSACTTTTTAPMLPREGAARRRGGLRARGPGSLAARPLPCGTCPSVPEADRCVSRQGESVGKTELPEFRVPCPAQHLPLHAACRGPCPL